ncbi:HTH-type transcriptional regulator HmrR [Poriferisphaera corsica]|uniref:HTH-type transcriptional regulator HmrR n=1 Tax=Poriferisphaera corsica TaxID=2528020 RepID=A0A517YR75_9BACT|nr:MerR family transcriptional regulator [Poriferisphaera corsica]QDU32733.1 HTH-type transcriptional regulator HmrR [Poriferisphaera corsica]
MFSIGEFSKVSGLSVKALRFYHEKGVLVPARVEGVTGYRFYDWENVEQARVVVMLRGLEFSIEEIKGILKECEGEGDLLERLEKRKSAVKAKIKSQRDVLAALDQVINFEKASLKMKAEGLHEIEERVVDGMLVGGVRMKGRYEEMGKVFGKLGRGLNRHIGGNAMCLYYDGVYKEEGADFEPIFPVKKAVKVEGIDVRELYGGRAICLKHVGPYDKIGDVYGYLFEYAKEKGYEVVLPTREVYLKGPGMIFKGNPEKYVTEVQMLIA